MARVCTGTTEILPGCGRVSVVACASKAAHFFLLLGMGFRTPVEPKKLKSECISEQQGKAKKGGNPDFFSSFI